MTKDIFLKKPTTSIQLHAKDLPAIARAYEQKYKIKIIINGESPLGHKIIGEHDQAYNIFLNNFDNAELKYAAYICAFWKHSSPFTVSDNYGSGFVDSFQEIFNVIKNFLLSKGINSYTTRGDLLNANIDTSDLKNLSQEFSKLSAYEKIKKTVDANIEKSKAVLIAERDDACLAKHEMKAEVSAIQENLSKDEYVGYFYTNYHRQKESHFEIIIISKNNIIRPADWESPDRIYAADLAMSDRQLSDIGIRNLVKQKVKSFTGLRPTIPFAQSSVIECGTLGMIYLKELLKEDARQLKDLCLTVPYQVASRDEDEPPEKFRFFFPSPWILRYSQSSAFNNIIESMLADQSAPVEFTHKREKNEVVYSVTTLRGMLEQVLASNPSDELEKECKVLLEKLPSFREKWLKEYEEVKKLRQRMDVDGKNAYLSYKNEFIKDKGTEAYRQMLIKRSAANQKAPEIPNLTTDKDASNKNKMD